MKSGMDIVRRDVSLPRGFPRHRRKHNVFHDIGLSVFGGAILVLNVGNSKGIIVWRAGAGKDESVRSIQ